MRYPVAIETGDAKHAFGVAVPDLPGCFSAGHTLDDALTNSREAILLHLEALLDDEQPFPAPSPIFDVFGKLRTTVRLPTRTELNRSGVEMHDIFAQDNSVVGVTLTTKELLQYGSSSINWVRLPVH